MTYNPFGPWSTVFAPRIRARLLKFGVPRMTTLSDRRWQLPDGARGQRCVLLALAMIAGAMPIVRGNPPISENGIARKDAQGAPQTASAVEADEKALKEFLDTYRLAPGQTVKRIEPPRPDGIRVYWKREYPGSRRSPDEVRSFTFGWSDPDRLKLGWSQFGGSAGFRISNLPRAMEMDLFPVEIEGDSELVNREISGDWVFRQGVPPEDLVRQLETILQRTLRMRITLAFRHVEHDVVVARGQYRHSPVAHRSKNQIEIFGKQIVPNGGGAGGGTGTFPEFLRSVGEWIGRPVVNEVGTPPQEKFEWFFNARSPFTEQMQREDHEEASVLKHLQEQTGFVFTREKKPIRVLVIERPKRTDE
jgi:hypothetical protein